MSWGGTLGCIMVSGSRHSLMRSMSEPGMDLYGDWYGVLINV